MTKSILIALLALVGSAQAQTVTSTTSGFCCDGGRCWVERGNICHSNPAEREELVFQRNDGISVNAVGAPRCPDGRTLVRDSAGQPKCAADLTEPLR